MGSFRAPTRLELMARFGRGEHAEVIDEVLDLTAHGQRHQPRVRGGTRVRVTSAFRGPGYEEPIYRVDVLEADGRATGYWAEVKGANLTEAAALGWRDWLRSMRR